MGSLAQAIAEHTGRWIVAADLYGFSLKGQTSLLERGHTDSDSLVAWDRWIDQNRTTTWSAAEILDQHLRMRLQYPEVRLVWSDEWRTFTIRGWWVTIAGVTFRGPDPANDWCDSRGIAVDECFAKLVSDTRDPAGTTKYRR